MDPDTLTVALVGAGGVIIGAVITSFAGDWSRRRHERKSLRAAFRAEISTLLKISEARGHEARFQRIIDNFDRTGQELPIFLWGFNAVGSDPVFKANIEKIGTLGADVAEDIGDFYTLLNAVRVDLVATASGQLVPLQPAQRIEVYRNALRLWRDAKAVGERLCKTL